MKKFSMPVLVWVLCCYFGLHNGYLALLDSRDSQPVQVFPYRAELYPEADQEALRHGIPVTSQKMLSRLMEDYLS